MKSNDLTEAEIMKALECCSKDEINGLNIFTYGDVPMRSLLKYALDLINRKNAEIERVTKERDNITKTYTEVVDAWKITRAEAIKEFAERVKKTVHQECGEGNPLFSSMVSNWIDQIAKEMGVEL